MKSKWKVIFFLLVIITISTIFVTLGISNKEAKLVNVEYYFYNPCKSCTEGEEFKMKLEGNISEANIVDSDSYKITVKNIAENNTNEEFKKLTKDMSFSNEIEASVPLLKVNDIFIFGIEAIEKEGIEIIEQESKRR